MKIPGKKLVPLLLILSITACSTTKLTSVWVDGESSAQIKSLLVVGIQKETHRRRVFEDSLVSGLAEQGVGATASYRIDGLADNPAAEDILNILPELNVDGVLAVRLLGVDSETVYHPPTVDTVPYGYYGSFGRYYGSAYTHVSSPGYYSEHTVVSLETNLYDAQSRSLLWSAQSQTVDPESADKLAVELSKEVVTGLMNTPFFKHE